MKLRNLKKMQTANDGNRTLLESIVIPEVVAALKDWKQSTNSNAILIGGLATSFYAKPRGTTDIDLLFLNENEIPDNVTGFKRIRQPTFEHNETGVEIEVLTPQFINISSNLTNQIFESAITIDGINVASASGIVALKLQRLENYDEGDIIALIKTGNVDLTGFELSKENLENFEEIKNKL